MPTPADIRRCIAEQEAILSRPASGRWALTEAHRKLKALRAELAQAEASVPAGAYPPDPAAERLVGTMAAALRVYGVANTLRAFSVALADYATETDHAALALDARSFRLHSRMRAVEEACVWLGADHTQGWTVAVLINANPESGETVSPNVVRRILGDTGLDAGDEAVAAVCGAWK